jgi:phosphate/sulfate permease
MRCMLGKSNRGIAADAHCAVVSLIVVPVVGGLRLLLLLLLLLGAVGPRKNDSESNHGVQRNCKFTLNVPDQHRRRYAQNAALQPLGLVCVCVMEIRLAYRFIDWPIILPCCPHRTSAGRQTMGRFVLTISTNKAINTCCDVLLSSKCMTSLRQLISTLFNNLVVIKCVSVSFAAGCPHFPICHVVLIFQFAVGETIRH